MARRRPKAVWANYTAAHLRRGELKWVINSLVIKTHPHALPVGSFRMMFYIPSKHAFKLTSQRKLVRGFHDSQIKVFKHHIPTKRTEINWRDL